jgi:hypothetical protein
MSVLCVEHFNSYWELKLWASTALPANLLSVSSQLFDVVGKTLEIAIDGGGTMSCLFTGTSPLMASAVAAQLQVVFDAEPANATAVAVDGRISITTGLTGSTATIDILVGDANPVFGWDDSSIVVGVDPIAKGDVQQIVYADHQWFIYYWGVAGVD